ncbi:MULTISPECIES: hypothetical protein [Pseudomonas]|uniref:DUF2059 domain-containing protein n=1 Tax=Pseudomonas spirodelae TaxID=3101751 RepID=A0ABU5P830_9PSED|nr:MULTISPECIES: hypothetical protein [unclassified Pseudomonas]MDD2159831.1 hypothetical protein [Pseudomonas sp. MIL19]MEA1605827.1 hypothetical protein [Pseudomonas sp. T5W1]
MRLLLIALLFSTLAHAAPPKTAAFAPVFELAGIRLLCEQAAPLVQRGLPDKQQAQLGNVFAADALCLDLAKRLASQLDKTQLQQAQRQLESPLAQRFTAAERLVGEGGAQGLTAYREQLVERPPREERRQLVRRLDAAAHTTTLATLLRYEVGKTQAFLALQGRGESIDEQALSTQTQAQENALRASSAEAVESFMLYAYRQMPSEQLAEYAALYEQPAVALLLDSSAQVLPELFAARRAQLKK